MTAPLSRYVRPNLGESRIARQWGAIAARTTHRSTLRPALVIRLVVVATALMGAIALVLVLRAHRRGPGDAMEGSSIESGAVTLADGSHLAVSDGARLRVETLRDDSVVLALDAGSVDLVVPHTRRTLIVRTRRFDVVDLGTRFRVVLGADGAERVDVSEGSVEIRSRVDKVPVRRLEGGESWSSAPTVAPPPVASASADPALVEPTNGPAPEPSPSLPSSPSTTARDPGASPRDLLETAERARLGGQPRAACAALDTLRRRFRSDPRAPLAAFELGRLRLDSLGDAHGSLEAFDDAIALAPRGPLRQDAEARRVEALSADRSLLCAAARDAFLERYPKSVHAAVVAAQCSHE